MSSADWVGIGERHGYDPRGLGGFFSYSGSMAVEGDMRVLTENGLKFLREYEARFGPRP